jgi:tetratricopeptide (TPR) repeat protein
MPKSRAIDGGHTVFTDHSIPRGVGKPRQQRIADLQPYFTESRESGSARNLGLAYAEAGGRLNRADWLQKAWPLLRQAAIEGPGDPALYAEIATFLDAAGRRDEAIHYYRLSLESDGTQFDAQVNLARLLEQKGDRTEAAELRKRGAEACPRCLIAAPARVGNTSRQ